MAGYSASLGPKVGIAAPQTLGPAPTQQQGMTSDQQLAHYWQLMSQMPTSSYEQVAPDYSQNSGSGDNATGGGDAAARSMADNLTRANQNTAFEATLSPADKANYEALTQQHNNDSQHYSNNLGWLSLAAPLMVYGAYGAAGAGAGTTGAAEGTAAGSAEGVSGMDLAADAAAGSGNSAAYAGGQLGAGSAGTGAGVAGSYTPAAGSAIPEAGAAGEGVVGTTTGTSLDAAQTAALGSGGTGTSLSQLLQQGAKSLAGQGGQQSGGGGGGLMGLFGGGGGMTAGDRYRQQLLSQSLRDGQQQQPQAMPGWIPGG